MRDGTIQQIRRMYAESSKNFELRVGNVKTMPICYMRVASAACVVSTARKLLLHLR